MMKMSKNIAITFICVILGLMLSLQYKSVYKNSKTAEVQNKTISELRQMVLDEKKKNDDLEKRFSEVEKVKNEYENSNNITDTTIKNLNEEVKRLKVMSGLATVKGKGVIVTLYNDGPAYVEEKHILDIINELRAADAEAISVNEERILAMTEIRETARNVIVINGKQFLAPFTIKAICNSDKVEHSLKMIGGVVERFEERDFIKVEIKNTDEIIIQKVKDDGITVKYDLLNPVEE